MSNHKRRNKMSDQILEDWVGVPLPRLPHRARLGTTTAPERIVVTVLMEVAVMIDVVSTEFGDDVIVGIPTLVPDQHFTPDEIAAAQLSVEDTLDASTRESARMFNVGDILHSNSFFEETTN